MSLFTRLKDLTLSNIYALIDKAEDPIKMTDQYLRNMQMDLEDAEKAVAAQLAIEKKYQQLYSEQEAFVNKRNDQAHLAAQAQNVDLARRALMEKKEAEQKAKEYQEAYQQHKEATEALRDKWKSMQKEVKELIAKRDTLAARARAAKAQRDINHKIKGISSTSSLDGLRRMEDRVRQLEAEAEVSEEMIKKEPSLDEEMAKLQKDNEIEDELSALLKKYEN